MTAGDPRRTTDKLLFEITVFTVLYRGQWERGVLIKRECTSRSSRERVFNCLCSRLVNQYAARIKSGLERVLKFAEIRAFYVW